MYLSNGFQEINQVGVSNDKPQKSSLAKALTVRRVAGAAFRREVKDEVGEEDKLRHSKRSLLGDSKTILGAIWHQLLKFLGASGLPFPGVGKYQIG